MIVDGKKTKFLGWNIRNNNININEGIVYDWTNFISLHYRCIN